MQMFPDGVGPGTFADNRSNKLLQVAMVLDRDHLLGKGILGGVGVLMVGAASTIFTGQPNIESE